MNQLGYGIKFLHPPSCNLHPLLSYLPPNREKKNKTQPNSSKTILPLTTIQLIMEQYEILDHTADIFIKAKGSTLAEAFEHAAIGMFDQIYPTSDVEPVGEFQVDLQNDDIEQLLVEWLSELLYIYETQKVIFSRFKVNLDEESKSLISQAYGVTLDPDKHVISNEIKAVTYHMLEIGREDETYFVKVLFDI